MKNTHHAEMDERLIGRDLSWVEDGGIFREEPVPYRVASEKPGKHESPSKKRKWVRLQQLPVAGRRDGQTRGSQSAGRAGRPHGIFGRDAFHSVPLFLQQSQGRRGSRPYPSLHAGRPLRPALGFGVPPLGGAGWDFAAAGPPKGGTPNKAPQERHIPLSPATMGHARLLKLSRFQSGRMKTDGVIWPGVAAVGAGGVEPWSAWEIPLKMVSLP